MEVCHSFLADASVWWLAAAAPEAHMPVPGFDTAAMLLCCSAGEDIPEWFAFRSVVKVLREAIAEESSASDTDSS